jgi:hypothetical protein
MHTAPLNAKRWARMHRVRPPCQAFIGALGVASTCLLLAAACCVAPAPDLAHPAPLIASHYGTVCLMRGNLLVTRGEDPRDPHLMLMKVHEINGKASHDVDVWLPLIADSAESREALRVLAAEPNSHWSIEVVGWEGLWGLGDPTDPHQLRLKTSAFDQLPQRTWSLQRNLLAWRVVSVARGARTPHLREYRSLQDHSRRIQELPESPSLPFDGEIAEFCGDVKVDDRDGSMLVLDVMTIGGRAVDNCELEMLSCSDSLRSDSPDILSSMQAGWRVRVVGWHAFSFRGAVRDPHGLIVSREGGGAGRSLGGYWRKLIVCSWERVIRQV